MMLETPFMHTSLLMRSRREPETSRDRTRRQADRWWKKIVRSMKGVKLVGPVSRFCSPSTNFAVRYGTPLQMR